MRSPSVLFLLGLALLAAPARPCLAVEATAVAIVNPAAAAPSQEVVRSVYLSGSTTLTPFDLPSSSPLHDEFYRHVIGREPAQVKAAWARIVFTGRGLPPKTLPDVAAVKRAVAGNPRAIGYVGIQDVDASVKAAPLPIAVPE